MARTRPIRPAPQAARPRGESCRGTWSASESRTPAASAGGPPRDPHRRLPALRPPADALICPVNLTTVRSRPLQAVLLPPADGGRMLTALAAALDGSRAGPRSRDARAVLTPHRGGNDAGAGPVRPARRGRRG